MSTREHLHLANHTVSCTFCPVCLEPHRIATAVALDGHQPEVGPKPGDFTVCAACAAILQFNEHMKECAVPPEIERAYFASLDRTLQAVLLHRREQARRRLQPAD